MLSAVSCTQTLNIDRKIPKNRVKYKLECDGVPKSRDGHGTTSPPDRVASKFTYLVKLEREFDVDKSVVDMEIKFSKFWRPDIWFTIKNYRKEEHGGTPQEVTPQGVEIRMKYTRTDAPPAGKMRATQHDVLPTFRPAVTSAKLFANGSFTPAEAEAMVVAGTIDGVFFGVPWLAHPDLARRARHEKPLGNEPDVKNFYGHPDTPSQLGFTDYPTWPNYE
ncbi:hypothetical protein DFH09DRAFT_1296522 [Mycena vulgaris]|nr:hypothetical protein DFH09DRAFT_1296522 [Mycena vulgaris]